MSLRTYFRSITIAVLLAALIGDTATARVAVVAGPVVVNTFTTSRQLEPHVTAASSGTFVVTWTSATQDGGDYGEGGVFAQRWGATSAPDGDEFQVNSYTYSSQSRSVGAMGQDGEYTIVWSSFGQDGDGSGIFLQRFDPGGGPIEGETAVNAYTTDVQSWPAVSMAPDGSFVVVWEAHVPDSPSLDVMARQYDAAGAPQEMEFRVNTYTTAAQRFPDVAHDGVGNFAIVWLSGGTFDSELEQDGSGVGVFGRAYSPTGALSAEEFLVPTYTTEAQANPSISGVDTGGFVVAWAGAGLSPAGTTNYGVFSRTISSEGGVQGGAEYLGRSDVAGQGAVEIGIDSRGLGLVIWEAAVELFGAPLLRGRLVSAVGPALGEEFDLETGLGSMPVHPSVAAYDRGRYAVVWTEQAPSLSDGDAESVKLLEISGAGVCGDVDADGSIDASDALAALRAAVGLYTCSLCECDVDLSQGIAASDALRVLSEAVGVGVGLSCSICL